MEWNEWIERVRAFVKRYRLLMLLLLCGILLICIPSRQANPKSIQEIAVQADSFEVSLSKLLSQVSGAGKVSVFLSESRGAETVYHSGDSFSKSSLISRTDPPSYRGAVVLCQGAGSPAVKLAIAQAVANATGLSYDNITVLKMK